MNERMNQPKPMEVGYNTTREREIAPVGSQLTVQMGHSF